MKRSSGIALVCAVWLSLGAAPTGAHAIASAGSGARAHARKHVQTVSERISAATAQARALLRTLRLPSSAAVSATEPPGDGGVLARPAQFAQFPDVVDAHALWIVPGTPSALMGYIYERLPSNTQRYGGLPPSQIGSVGIASIRFPEGTGAIGERLLSLTSVALADGRTGLRADALVGWLIPPTPIPPGARLLRVTVKHLRQAQVTHVVRITSRRRIAAIARLLDAQPVAGPRLTVRSCPASRVDLRLAFYRRQGSPPIATVDGAIGGCGGITVEIPHHLDSPRSFDATFLASLEHDLHVSLTQS